mgnify:CR=1 FL=1
MISTGLTLLAAPAAHAPQTLFMTSNGCIVSADEFIASRED